MNAISIFIIEDNKGIRNAMVTYLSKYPEIFSSILVFDSVEEFLESIQETVEILLLDINLPGVEAIIHILQRMELMQLEIISLKSRLRFYED